MSYIASIILEGGSTVEDAIVTGGSSKRVVAEGTLQDMDVLNRNKRIYAKEDLMPEINGPRMAELIKAKQFCGEYGHPLSDDLVRQQTIDPKLVCVRFNKVWVEGNLVKAQFQGTNNDYGSYLDQDLRDGCKPAFSLRALGGIENVNGKAYVKGIKIITWDSVIYPSHKAAYTDKVLTESACGEKQYNQRVVPFNDPGTIIHLSGSDANTFISQVQRESANLDFILSSFDGQYTNATMLNESSLMLTNSMGGKINVRLEDHVQNLIMNNIL